MNRTARYAWYALGAMLGLVFISLGIAQLITR